MNSNAVSAYRTNRIQGATPVGLVVLLYEGAIGALHRAIYALEQNDIEKRVSELNKALAVIAQLQGTLDYERGGETIPQTLNRFYDVMRGRILEASIRRSEPMLRSLIEHLGTMRDAWLQVEREVYAPAPVLQSAVSGNVGAAGYR